MTGAPAVSDEARLTQLNERYIASYMAADVEWYRANLTDDFLCIDSDGSVLDKTQFLQKTARGPDVAQYNLKQVRIRIHGDTALVHGTGFFTRPDGSTGMSRYTDVYLRVGRDWKAISAQITRSASQAMEGAA